MAEFSNKFYRPDHIKIPGDNSGSWTMAEIFSNKNVDQPIFHPKNFADLSLRLPPFEVANISPSATREEDGTWKWTKLNEGERKEAHDKLTQLDKQIEEEYITCTGKEEFNNRRKGKEASENAAAYEALIQAFKPPTEFSARLEDTGKVLHFTIPPSSPEAVEVRWLGGDLAQADVFIRAKDTDGNDVWVSGKQLASYMANGTECTSCNRDGSEWRD